MCTQLKVSRSMVLLVLNYCTSSIVHCVKLCTAWHIKRSCWLYAMTCDSSYCYVRQPSLWKLRQEMLWSSSAGMGLALDRSGWMMSVVLVLNHVLPPAQTEELDQMTVVILRMWRFTVHVCLTCLYNDYQPSEIAKRLNTGTHFSCNQKIMTDIKSMAIHTIYTARLVCRSVGILHVLSF